MVVASAIVLVLIASHVVMERYFRCQSAFGEKLESPIYRREPDLRVAFLHEPVQFLCGEMFARLKEGSQDRVTLFGVFQPHALQMRIKALLRLTQGLARDRSVIVDSLGDNRRHAAMQRLLQNSTHAKAAS